MTTIFQQAPTLQAPSRIARAAQGLSDTDLAGIVGGGELGERQRNVGILPGVAATLPFSSGLQQLPVGATGEDSVPWVELKPAVKQLDSTEWVVPVA